MTSGLRKAAVLLMSLPQDEAAAVLSKLKPKQIEAVSIEIARLDQVAGTEQESVIYEFAEANPNALLRGGGGLDLATSLVPRALGKDARDTLDTVQQSIEALPFGFLKKVDPQNVVTYINDEHPQTIALILSHLPPAYGARIIAGLSPERQMAVIQRIAHMGQTNPEVIKQVEEGLESRMASVMSQQFENAGGVSSVAEILNVADRATDTQSPGEPGAGRSGTGGGDPSPDVLRRLEDAGEVSTHAEDVQRDDARDVDIAVSGPWLERSSEDSAEILGPISSGPVPAPYHEELLEVRGVSDSRSTFSSHFDVPFMFVLRTAKTHGYDADDAAVPGRQGGLWQCAAAVPDGGFLRALLR